MGLSCRISYSNGRAVVVDSKGNNSKLYNDLLAYTKNESDALDMWVTAYSREYGRKGEDTNVLDLVKFFDSYVASSQSLTPAEKFQVQDFMRRNNIEYLSDLNKIMTTIFKSNGVFKVNPEAAINSGLFSQEEIRDLNLESMKNILLKIEGQLTKENFFVEPEGSEYEYQDSSKKSIFGTYYKVSQTEVDQDILKSIDNFTDVESFYNGIRNLPYEDFVNRFLEDDTFANEIMNRFGNLKKIPKLSFVDGKLSADNNRLYTTINNTIIASLDTKSLEADMEYLDSIRDSIWSQNFDLVSKVLKEVEETFANANIDIVGISEQADKRGPVMELIRAGIEMAQNPNKQTIKNFVANHKALIPSEDTVVVENLPNEYVGYNIVSLYTNKSEGELFAKHGLIKVGENLYHKVSQDANINDLREYLFQEIKSKKFSLPENFRLEKDLNNKPRVLEDISRYLLSREIPKGISNRELYSAYQVAFNHLPIESREQDLRLITSIRTDVNYLKTAFVADFYNYMLKEKVKNSDVYNSVLSKLEITDRDIVMISPIKSLEGIEYSKELQDYIKLQKDSNMKYLVEAKDELVSEDLMILNFPNKKSEFEGDFIMDGKYVITQPTSDNYIKLNNIIYRKGLERDNAAMFVQITPKVDSTYYTTEMYFEFDRLEANTVFDRYGMLSPNAVDYNKFNNVIAKSRLNDEMNARFKEKSTLTDKSYVFYEVNNSIVAYKDGVRVGSIRYTKTENAYVDPQVSVSELHRSKGIGTELFLRMFDKISKEGKKVYIADIRTQQADNVISRLSDLIVREEDGGYSVKKPESVTNFQQLAWHGSPYRFDKFTTEKMGTGEGIQAFGWGLYFTDLEVIARRYAKTLKQMRENRKGFIQGFLNNAKAIVGIPTTNLYQVALFKGKTPSEYTWLEWDKKVNKKQVENLFSRLTEEQLSIGFPYGLESDAKNVNMYRGLSKALGSDKAASLFLLENGIDGIKYPAESLSRGATSETARGFNYVVFDENAIEIEEAIQFMEQTSVRELAATPREAFGAIVDRLYQTGLAKEVVVDSSRFSQMVRRVNFEDATSGAVDTIAGFERDGVVYVNPKFLNFNTPIHEFGHLWLNWAKSNRKDLHDKGVELVRDSAYHDLIKERAKDKNSVYYGYTEERILDEALATAIGDRGEQLVQNKYKSFSNWLSELWQSIKNALGITQMSAQQVSNLTLEEFTDAVAIDMLRGEKYDTTQYTITTLLDPMLAGREGKLVNVQSIEQIMKQPTTKQVEKDIIKEVLNLEGFQGKSKISFDDFSAEVRARIMPLKVIETTSYADFGISRTGIDTDNFITKIYNTDLDHQVKGHFTGDFTNGSNVDFEIVNLGNEYAVVRSGVSLTQENLAENVFTATTSREAAEQWISNYNKANNVNAGLFGHTRVWYSGNDVYLAEVQSDSYQKAKAKDMVITSYKNGSSKLNDAQKEIYKELKEAEEIINNARKARNGYENVTLVSDQINDQIEYIKRLDRNINFQKELLVGNPENQNIKESLITLENRKKISQQDIDGLIKLTKGEEITLPEQVDWSETYPGGQSGQFGIRQLPFGEINSFKRPVVSFSIDTNGKKSEYVIDNRTKEPVILSGNKVEIEAFITELNIIRFNFVEGYMPNMPENFPELESILFDMMAGNSIETTKLKEAIKKQFPIITSNPNGRDGLYNRSTDITIRQDQIKNRGRSEDNLLEIDRTIRKLRDQQDVVRNSRDFEAIQEEIDDLTNKRRTTGLLSESEQNEYNSLQEEKQVIDNEIKLYTKLGGQDLVDKIDNLPEGIKIKMSVPIKTVYQLRDTESGDRTNFYNLDNAFEAYKNEILPTVKPNTENYLKYQNASRNLSKIEDRLIDKADVNIKQFIAHRKNYSTRLLREEIRRNAEQGFKTLAIPTPRTLALIEGFISSDEATYTVLEGNPNQLTSGDTISYGDQQYIVLNSDSTTFDAIATSDAYWIDADEFRYEIITSEARDLVKDTEAIIEYDREYTEREILNIPGFARETLSNVPLEQFIEGDQTRFDVDSYDNGKTWEVRDTTKMGQEGEVLLSFDSEEEANNALATMDQLKVYTFSKPSLQAAFENYLDSRYDVGRRFIEDNYSVDEFTNVHLEKDGLMLVASRNANVINLLQLDQAQKQNKEFDIEQLSDKQKTVVEKYTEFTETFKKERPGFTIVEDSKGNEWFTTNLTEKDGKKPVVVFQEMPSTKPSSMKSIENVSSIFDSQLELLDLYSPKEESEILKEIDSCGI